VPAHIEPLTREEAEKRRPPPELTAELREVIEPDIFITGDANLLMEPEEKRDANTIWSRESRPSSRTSACYFLILSPKIFPVQVPTQEEVNLGQKLIDIYMLPTSAIPRPPLQSAHQPEGIEPGSAAARGGSASPLPPVPTRRRHLIRSARRMTCLRLPRPEFRCQNRRPLSRPSPNLRLWSPGASDAESSSEIGFADSMPAKRFRTN